MRLPPGPDHARRPRHRDSHRRLIHRDVSPEGWAPVDAVVVPATRPAPGLTPALKLAAALDCPLLALCSRGTAAAEVRDFAAETGVDAVALDLPQPSTLPDLLTTALLADGPFARHSDTSLKRNIGLAVTRMTGWRRILFLDDDIDGVDADAVRRAATLLPAYGAVGLENTGYPDNSVVCHANRDTGNTGQDTFVGAGALLVPGRQVTSFFPDVYNEDWFFLLDGHGIVDVAGYGSFAQDRFDPYPNPSRAGQEEFGDCLAEGLFSLLDDGRTMSHADHAFWRAFIGERHALIEAILKRVPSAPLSTVRRQQVAAALRAARRSLLAVRPENCVSYLEAWRHDRERWQRFIGRLPGGLTPRQALKTLNLDAG